MVFDNTIDSEIAPGQAVKQELFKKHQDSLDAHETEIQTFAALAKKVVIFDGVVKNASSASSLTGLSAWRVPAAMTLIDAKLGLITPVGSLTGTLEMNVRKATSLDDSAAVSVFTTRPSIAMASASDYDESANMVLDANVKDLAVGEYLFLDISSLVAGGIMGRFTVYLIAEV